MLKSLLSSCKRGFTLIELLILVVIVSILAAIALPVIFGASKASSSGDDNFFGSKQAMIGYVNDMYPELQSVRASCANFDSDGDGYIRCAATGVNPATNSRDTVEAECGFFLNAGKCVPIKMAGRRW